MNSALIALVAVAPASVALATPQIRDAFLARYPQSTLLQRTEQAQGQDCFACHQPPSTSREGNCYRIALRARLDAGRTRAQALADVELLDSDGDGIDNITEILMVRTDEISGVGYNPGLIGALGTDPCAADTTLAVTEQWESPPPPPPPCPADIGAQGGLPGQDHALNNNDFVVFINWFFAADARADVGIQGGLAGSDGQFNNNDFVVYIDSFFAGCP